MAINLGSLLRIGPELLCETEGEPVDQAKIDHPAVGGLLTNLCRIWWHSLQSVIRLVSVSSPRALRLLMW
jgi:hypothetical protein